MSAFVYFSLFLSVIISGLSVLFIKINNRNLKLILAFSGAYLFAISVLHLIPEIYSTGSKTVGVFILIGFFLQILLEFFSEGIEHGHVHVHQDKEHAFPLAMMIGLSVHSFLEGMPLAGGMHNHNEYELHQTENSLLIGIILHNIPIAVALMTMLLQSHISKQKAVLLLMIFALAAPAGTLVSHLVGKSLTGDISIYFNAIMGVVIGIFLHISTTILFESSENHRFNLLKFGTIVSGALVAFLVR